MELNRLMVSFNEVIAALVHRPTVFRLSPRSHVVSHGVRRAAHDTIESRCIALLVVVHLLDCLVLLLDERRIKLGLSD